MALQSEIAQCITLLPRVALCTSSGVGSEAPVLNFPRFRRVIWSLANFVFMHCLTNRFSCLAIFCVVGQFLLEAGYLLNWGLGRTTRLLPCTTSTVVVAITCIVGRIVAAATATGSIVVREQPTIVVMVMVVTCNEKRAISMRLW